MNLWRYVAKRLLLMIPTLLGVLLLTFASGWLKIAQWLAFTFTR